MAKVKLIKAHVAQKFTSKQGKEMGKIEARYELQDFHGVVLEDLKSRFKKWDIELGKIKKTLIIKRVMPWEVFEKEQYSHTNTQVVEAYKRAETNAGLAEFTQQEEELL